MIHKRIAFLCMLLPCTLWGQTDRTSPTGRIEFLPPEAASLMRYVDYPVSHLTGVPDIRIPLHTVQIGKISLPLTLMFHTDNYSRPNQLAGSVGKGWSLSTELQITRQVNGLDDLNPSTLTPGYYYASDIPTDYREGDAVQRSELNAKELYYGRRDEEPDRFYYRLLDKSGAFYFRHRPDGSVEAVPVPYNGVKIEYEIRFLLGCDRHGAAHLGRNGRQYRDCMEMRVHIQPPRGTGGKLYLYRRLSSVCHHV